MPEQTAEKGQIICGFAGIGKSTAALNMPGVVDLESTPFERDWERYSKVARHMAGNGYTVLLSCHRELREQLARDGATYLLAMPPQDAKDAYLDRYVKRGNTTDFVALFDAKWSSFLAVLPGERVLEIEGFLGDRDLSNPPAKRGDTE